MVAPDQKSVTQDMTMRHESDGQKPEGSRSLRLVLLSILGACLVWIILTRSLAASLAESSPETALFLQPQEPRALLTLARAELNALLKETEAGPDTSAPPVEITPDNGPPDRLATLSRLAEAALLNATPEADRDPEFQRSMDSQPSGAEASSRGDVADKTTSIRELAETAIAADPFNAEALGILGQLAERSGDTGRTAPLMEAAARLSIRESYAVYWLMQRAQRETDNPAVLRYADTLLRTRGRAVPLVVPILAQMAETKDRTSDVTALLRDNPPWRPAFFANLSNSITNARTPLFLLLGLQGTAHPPTALEISGYINFLISRNFHELAYYTWLQFLPAEELARISPLYNRSFESTPSGLPFDWVLTQGNGVTTEIRRRTDNLDEHALVLEFGQGRSEFPGVTQLTLLGPGNYTLKGKHKGTLVGRRGLVWRVNCAAAQRLAESDLLRGNIPQWREFTLSFTVPQTGCRAQQVRLDFDARSASERLISGSMWFDDLELRRIQP
jgi:hypothetical protein